MLFTFFNLCLHFSIFVHIFSLSRSCRDSISCVFLLHLRIPAILSLVYNHKMDNWEWVRLSDKIKNYDQKILIIILDIFFSSSMHNILIIYVGSYLSNSTQFLQWVLLVLTLVYPFSVAIVKISRVEMFECLISILVAIHRATRPHWGPSCNQGGWIIYHIFYQLQYPRH